MDDSSAYQSAERAEIYDAVYANVGDVAFWEGIAAQTLGGPLLELGRRTGRLTLPLARAGHHILGIASSNQAIQQGDRTG